MSIRITGGLWRGRLLDVPKKGVRPTQDRVRAAVFSSLQGVIPGARVLDLFAGTGAFGLEALSRGAALACFVENDNQALVCLAKNVERLLGNAGQKWRIARSDVEHFLAENQIQTNQMRKSFRNPPRPLATPPQEGILRSSEVETCDPLLGGVRDQSRRSGCAKGEAGGGSEIGRRRHLHETQTPYDLIFADPPYDAGGDWTKKILFHLSRWSILAEKGYLIIESGAKSPLIEAAGWDIYWERSYGETRICIYKQKAVHSSRFTVVMPQADPPVAESMVMN